MMDNPRFTFENTQFALQGDAEEAVKGNNRFALDLYLKLSKNVRSSEKEDNVFLSPWSICSAIVMTYEGARGRTAVEMQSVMHFPKNDDARRRSFALLHNEINANDTRYALTTANAIWVQEGYSLLREFMDVIEKYYYGGAMNVDFYGAAEEARQTINSWVEKRTNGKVKDLIPKGFLDGSLLVLTNAIYFKGRWAREFNKSLTRDEDFLTGEGRIIKIPMMRSSGTNSRFNYMETEGIQMLEVPYQGEGLSMLILLPKKDILSLERSLTINKLLEWKKSLKDHRVEAYIPKFRLSTKYFLEKDLPDMGMPTAFGDADFSGISGVKDLYIAHVIHQAFVEVNEEGTEAAASTAVIMPRGLSLEKGPEIPVFRADHPFIFMIQDKKTGGILFMGKVSDPMEK